MLNCVNVGAQGVKVHRNASISLTHSHSIIMTAHLDWPLGVSADHDFSAHDGDICTSLQNANCLPLPPGASTSALTIKSTKFVVLAPEHILVVLVFPRF